MAGAGAQREEMTVGENKNRCIECGGAGAGSDGLCTPCRLAKHHGPEARREYYQRIGRKGGEVRRRQERGLNDRELPQLDSPQTAALWLERIGRAVATGRLASRDATAATKAVEAWLRANEAGATAERLESLRQQVDELKRGKLKAVR